MAADCFYRAALGHLAAGAHGLARDACRAGLRVEPDHPGLNEALGLAEFGAERYGPAVHALEAASLFGPLGAEAQLALADCYVRFGQVQAAGAIVDFQAEPGRCPTPLLPDLARGLGRTGRYALALDVCQRLTVLRPSYHPAWFGVAYYLGQLGRPPGTLVRPLEAAFALAPRALTYRLNLAALYADLGRPADAYALVRGVPADAVRCRCLCRRLLPAFEHAGDRDGLAAYRDRADGAPAEWDDDAPWSAG
jgi:Flp pilus assembly protein TadD